MKQGSLASTDLRIMDSRGGGSAWQRARGEGRGAKTAGDSRRGGFLGSANARFV